MTIKYQIFVPVAISSGNNAHWLTNEVNKLIDEAIADFSRAEIHAKLPSISTKCRESSAEWDDGFVFSFECDSELTAEERSQAKVEFLAQLSKGWGERVVQKIVMLDRQETNISFSTRKAGELEARG